MFLRCVLFSLFLPAACFADEWRCENGTCTEVKARIEAQLTGTFVGHAGLSPDADADTFAALEQQSWREFQFSTTLSTTIDAHLSVAQPAEATEDTARPRLSLHLSEDGEAFMPLARNKVVPPDFVVSVILSQPRQSLDDGRDVFYPLDFAIAVSTRRVLREDEVGFFADLPAITPLLANALGCGVLGCGTIPHASHTPSVEGTSNPTPVFEAAPTVLPSAPDELARELQSELKRVGCYTIAIDGLWRPGSRRAMAAFNIATGGDYDLSRPTARALAGVARSEGNICN